MSKELITSHHSVSFSMLYLYHAFRPMIDYSFQSTDRAFNQPDKYYLIYWMWSKPNWWNHLLSKLTMTLRWINVSCLLASPLRKILYTESNLADLPEFHSYSCCQSKFFSFLAEFSLAKKLSFNEHILPVSRYPDLFCKKRQPAICFVFFLLTQNTTTRVWVIFIIPAAFWMEI